MIFKLGDYFRVIAEKEDGQVSAQQVEEEDEGSEASSLWGEGKKRKSLLGSFTTLKWWPHDDSTDILGVCHIENQKSKMCFC